jgi:hypothetical protein
MKHLFLASLLVLGFTTGCGHKNNPGTANAASLDDLNRALSVVAMRSGYLPPPTNEVAKFLALSGKTMPVAPPGKKLEIDPVQQRFVLVDQ